MLKCYTKYGFLVRIKIYQEFFHGIIYMVNEGHDVRIRK